MDAGCEQTKIQGREWEEYSSRKEKKELKREYI